MLVLSRHKNESIVINHEITVTVIDIRGDKVRLGIDAPKEMPVNRREIETLQENERRSNVGGMADCGHRTTAPRMILGRTYCPTCAVEAMAQHRE